MSTTNVAELVCRWFPGTTRDWEEVPERAQVWLRRCELRRRLKEQVAAKREAEANDDV